VMPYNYDQPDNAERVVRLGVGRTISRQAYSAERVTRELRELLTNKSYSRRALEISERMGRELGTETACDALEGLLESPSRAFSSSKDRGSSSASG